MKINYNGKPIAQVDQRFIKKQVVGGTDPRVGRKINSRKPVKRLSIGLMDIVKAIYILALIGVAILAVYNATN